ncbi:META domain-containing protein [uncultured Jatrophihabitans sp.]|uniref:META domain-containing protein n=1 Tax=uncultured Jatrophihabitans sp. TaxID=1610747 RepID=UPI0035CBD1E0
MSELEQQVRDALHRRGAAVTPALLRPEVGRSPARPPRRPWSWLTPVAAALSVLVAVVIVVAVSRGGSSDDKTGSGRTAAAALAGTEWRLTEVRYPDGRQVAVSDGVGAYIAFDSDGVSFGGSDSVNSFSGKYSVERGGSLKVSDGAITLVGYAGRDLGRLAALDGLGAFIGSGAGVAVDVNGHHLQLSAKGFTLTFAYGAPVATSSQPRPAEPS